MSCYFRHMTDIFDEIGIEATPDNKKEIDRIIHRMMEVEYKDCSPTWKEVKGHILGDEEKKRQFIKRLKDGLKDI
jgi:hypothetical protein